eukprot:SAG31_NODE_113_length_24342_cov_5.194530_16_plen_119_part_00
MSADPGGCLTTWRPATPDAPCTGWQGVSCDRQGHVTQVHPSGYDYHDSCGALAGTIPESIGQLAQLETLDLGTTLLSGTIPESIGQLTHLQRLYLSSTHIQGCAGFCAAHPRIIYCYC